MAKKKKPDLDALGAQYREVKESIATHRRRQAEAEVEHSRLIRRLGPSHPDIQAAWAAVEQAARDVAWCRALTVACGEAYKGVPFDQVPNDQAAIAPARDRALASLAADS